MSGFIARCCESWNFFSYFFSPFLGLFSFICCFILRVLNICFSFILFLSVGWIYSLLIGVFAPCLLQEMTIRSYYLVCVLFLHLPTFFLVLISLEFIINNIYFTLIFFPLSVMFVSLKCLFQSWLMIFQFQTFKMHILCWLFACCTAYISRGKSFFFFLNKKYIFKCANNSSEQLSVFEWSSPNNAVLKVQDIFLWLCTVQSQNVNTDISFGHNFNIKLS